MIISALYDRLIIGGERSFVRAALPEQSSHQHHERG